jgi:hypothetical protein
MARCTFITTNVVSLFSTTALFHMIKRYLKADTTQAPIYWANKELPEICCIETRKQTV